MKKIGIVISIVVCLMVSGLALAAGGGGGTTPAPVPVYTLPTDMYMVVSTKALESYAKEQVAQAASYGGSMGIVLPGGRTWAQVVTNNPDIRVIQQLLGKEVLSFQVADPETFQYFGGMLMDSQGWGLFWGWNYFQLQKDKYGNWQVPADASCVTNMVMADPLPIYIPGVNQAQIEIKDGNGNLIDYLYLQVQNDHVYFPKSYAGLGDNGWSGQIVLSVGGASAVYDMNTGANVPAVPINSAVQAGIGGLICLDNPLQIMSNPTSVSGQGENPFYQVSVSTGKKIGLYGVTTEGEIANGVLIRKVGDLNPTYYSITPGQILTVSFEAGVYDVWFDYEKFGNDTPYLPYNGGDGGLG